MIDVVKIDPGCWELAYVNGRLVLSEIDECIFSDGAKEVLTTMGITVTDHYINHKEIPNETLEGIWESPPVYLKELEPHLED